MRAFASLPAQPRTTHSEPKYPRLLGLGLIVASTACGGVAEVPAEGEGQGGYSGETPSGTGGVAAQPPGTGGFGAEPSGADAAPYPPPDGNIAPPFDAGPDGATVIFDAGPPPDGDIAPPYDAGEDAWTENPDAEPPMGGGVQAPYDAGCPDPVPGV